MQIGSPEGETQAARDAIRETPEYKAFARSVRIRDDNTCVTCGQIFKGGFNRLHVHHPWMFKFFPDFRIVIDKAVSLCERCHCAIHRIPYSGPLVIPIRGDTAASFRHGYTEGMRDAKHA